jgi:hypothetical protein
VQATIGNKTIDEGKLLSFQVSARDSDLVAGQPNTLTYSLDPGAPAGAKIDPVTGVFTWTPPTGSGTVNVTVRVTDNGSPGLSDFESITITVNAVSIPDPQHRDQHHHHHHHHHHHVHDGAHHPQHRHGHLPRDERAEICTAVTHASQATPCVDVISAPPLRVGIDEWATKQAGTPKTGEKVVSVSAAGTPAPERLGSSMRGPDGPTKADLDTFFTLAPQLTTLTVKGGQTSCPQPSRPGGDNARGSQLTQAPRR